MLDPGNKVGEQPSSLHNASVRARGACEHLVGSVWYLDPWSHVGCKNLPTSQVIMNQHPFPELPRPPRRPQLAASHEPLIHHLFFIDKHELCDLKLLNPNQVSTIIHHLFIGKKHVMRT